MSHVVQQISMASQSPSVEEVREVARHEALEVACAQKNVAPTPASTISSTVPGNAPVTGNADFPIASSSSSVEILGHVPKPAPSNAPVQPNLAYQLEPVGRGAQVASNDTIDPAAIFMMAQLSEPVCVQTATRQNSAQVNALNVGSAMQQLHAANFVLKNAVQPVFSGHADDYESFMADFDTFVSKISGGAPVSDDSMLNYLEPCLPEPLRRHVTTQRQNTKNAYTFAQMKTFLDQRFGDDTTEAARRKWEQVDLPKSGKIMSMEFLGFETEFRAAKARVKDATDHEARRLLVSKLPPSLSKIVFDEEEKRNSYNPELEFIGIPGMNKDGVSATILNTTTVSPKKVDDLGNGIFHVTVRSLYERDRVLELHGRVVARTGRALAVKSLRKDIPYEEVFTLLRTKVATRERTDAMQRVMSNRAVRQTRAKISNVVEDSDSDDDDKPVDGSKKVDSKPKGGNAQNSRSRSQSPATPKSPISKTESSSGVASKPAQNPVPQVPQSPRAGPAGSFSSNVPYWNNGKGNVQGWQGKGNSNQGSWGGRGGKGAQGKGGKGGASGYARSWNTPAQNAYTANFNRPNNWQSRNSQVQNSRGPPVTQNGAKGGGKGFPGGVRWPAGGQTTTPPQGGATSSSTVSGGGSAPASTQQ